MLAPGAVLLDHLNDAELRELGAGEEDYLETIENARQSRTRPPF